MGHSWPEKKRIWKRDAEAELCMNIWGIHDVFDDSQMISWYMSTQNDTHIP